MVEAVPHQSGLREGLGRRGVPPRPVGTAEISATGPSVAHAENSFERALHNRKSACSSGDRNSGCVCAPSAETVPTRFLIWWNALMLHKYSTTSVAICRSRSAVWQWPISSSKAGGTVQSSPSSSRRSLRYGLYEVTVTSWPQASLPTSCSGLWQIFWTALGLPAACLRTHGVRGGQPVSDRHHLCLAPKSFGPTVPHVEEADAKRRRQDGVLHTGHQQEFCWKWLGGL